MAAAKGLAAASADAATEGTAEVSGAAEVADTAAASDAAEASGRGEGEEGDRSARLGETVEHAGQVGDEALGAAALAQPRLVDLQPRRGRLLVQRLAERAAGLPGPHRRSLGERIGLGIPGQPHL